MKITKTEFKNSVLGAIMGIILTAFWDYIKNYTLFSTFHKIILFIWTNVLNINIPVWILFSLIFAWKILKFIFNRQESKNLSFEFLDYVEDVFDGSKWRWQWKKNSSGKYNVDNLTIVCGVCQTPMKFNEFSNCYICPRCNKRINDFKNPYDVESVIIDNLNRKQSQKF